MFSFVILQMEKQGQQDWLLVLQYSPAPLVLSPVLALLTTLCLYFAAMPLLNVFIQFLIVSVAQGAFGPRRPSLAEQAAFLHMEIDCGIWETGKHQSV